MYTRVVVPLDGSRLAERALPYAEELARMTGLPLHLIRVVAVVPAAGLAQAEYAFTDNLFVGALQDEESVADEYLATLQDHYAASNIQVTTERRAGKVTHELLAAASDGDLYVMASHGRGGVSRWFLGSVAEEITHHSRVPVMIIRANTANEERGAAKPRVPVFRREWSHSGKK
ncbi:MAG TPA: universal stress protein [Thermomicrobiaceae bacterium]|nr:universal stress protein [Thermomicrobiaceae bacterium]